jgi:hypothetical protein
MNEDDRIMIMSNALHFADISNQTKKWDVCFKWTEYLYEEFWNQGDKERELGLPLGFLMDRYKTNISCSQVSFIDSFVKPSFETLYILLPKLEQNLKFLDDNRQNWLNLKDYYDNELKKQERNLINN